MRFRAVVLAIASVIVLLAAVMLSAVLRPGRAGAGAGAGAGAVATVLTTVFVEPSRAAARHPQGAAITVTVPPMDGDGSTLRTPTGPLATVTPRAGSPSTVASTLVTSRSPGPDASSTGEARDRDATATSTGAGSPSAGIAARDHRSTRSTGVARAPGSTTRSGGPRDGAAAPPALAGASAATVPTSHRDPITPAPSASPTRIARAVTAAVQAAAAQGISQSVVVLDRASGRSLVRLNADRPVPAVSIAKLLFAADELDRAGGGANLAPDAVADLADMLARSNDALASDYYGYHGEGAIVQRVVERYGLDGTEPSPDSRYWGGITVTAADVASLLQQLLADPADAPYVAGPMRKASVIATDGYDQEFGMNAVSGAGSKQGWGCCLGGVVAIHSAGFTHRYIVVVLSTAAPDATGINVPEVSAFEDDPGFKASVAAVTATVRAAVDPPG